MRRFALLLILFLIEIATVAATAQDRPPLEIGTSKSIPGMPVRGWLAVAEAADGTSVSLPIVIIAGKEPGPIVWVQASAHGDEYGGPRALQQLVRSLDPAVMKGTVVAVLVSNPLAFRALQRVNPNLDDLEDMGDAFPGRPRFATERIAEAIAAQAKIADYFVDLHTGGDRFRQLPFVFYTLTGTVPRDRYDELARSFGIPTLWRDAHGVFEHDVTTLMSGSGKPAFLLEVGGGQPLDPADIRLQADAVRGLLRKVGVLPGEPPRLASYAVITGYRIVTNARGGFFEPSVKPGDRVRPTDVLGRMYDVWGELSENVTAPYGTAPPGSDLVLGVSTYPAAATGGWLFELGTGLQDVASPK
jgi:predicted deacylase